jgi:hypothetical protein
MRPPINEAAAAASSKPSTAGMDLFACPEMGNKNNKAGTKETRH